MIYDTTNLSNNNIRVKDVIVNISNNEKYFNNLLYNNDFLVHLQQIRSMTRITRNTSRIFMFATRLNTRAASVRISHADTAMMIMTPCFLRRLNTHRRTTKILSRMLRRFRLLMYRVSKTSVRKNNVTINIRSRITKTGLTVFRHNNKFNKEANYYNYKDITTLKSRSRSTLSFDQKDNNSRRVHGTPLKISRNRTTFDRRRCSQHK